MRRHLTDVARAAVTQARRHKRETAIPRETSKVYVVPLADADLQFGWGIRRFGTLVLDRKRTGFPPVQEARTGGEMSLGGQEIKA